MHMQMTQYHNPTTTCTSQKDSLLLSFDCKQQQVQYLSDMTSLSSHFEGRPFWEVLTEEQIAPEHTITQIRNQWLEISETDKPVATFMLCDLKAADGNWYRYRMGVICAVPHTVLYITLTCVGNAVSDEDLARAMEFDKLTGLRNRRAFCRNIEETLELHFQKGMYAILYIDINRFKAVNDIFGMAKGDDLLAYIGKLIEDAVRNIGVGCRIGSDRFAAFFNCSHITPEELTQQMAEKMAQYDAIPFEITFNTGIYLVEDATLSADSMLDRAVLAQSAIKGSYTVRYQYYTESMRNAMLGEQEIIGMMAGALAEQQFVVYYQPQYNHSTGMLIGAEALVRWMHPDKGLISPGAFIPIFEKNGFITSLDLYVFERICIFLQHCMAHDYKMVPISANFSRYDVFQPDYVEKIETIRRKYNVPTKYLRIELTESSVVGGSQYINEVISKLHHCGYIVEMDDFGSGYSSLNVLKDIDLDVIKLDMRFFSGETETKKSGTIISSVVRMAKWLSMPMIAEGVETVEQADFLRSIGCNYIQGYLYSRPIPEADYIQLLSSSKIGTTISQMRLVETLNAFDFWNPQSQETLIFNNYVGGAVIFEYYDHKMEILRVNKKYLREISMNLSEQELIQSDPLAFFDAENRKIYLDMLQRAIETGEEQTCDTWRTISSACCGQEKICLCSNVQMIGKSGDHYLFYATIRNVTSEKEYYDSILDTQKRFNMASEQVNIYYWEYTVATKEMRPCYRCMRDLGLPPVLTNYPDSAIARGIFPPEVADMYRDWHVQIANGVKELEAVIPLTKDRVPFRVRYTTEFDEAGNPIKAYGSAALVV